MQYKYTTNLVLNGLNDDTNKKFMELIADLESQIAISYASSSDT